MIDCLTESWERRKYECKATRRMTKRSAFKASSFSGGVFCDQQIAVERRREPMSYECGECEMDWRRGHAESCSFYKRPNAGEMPGHVRETLQASPEPKPQTQAETQGSPPSDSEFDRGYAEGYRSPSLLLAKYQVGHHASRKNCQCEPCVWANSILKDIAKSRNPDVSRIIIEEPKRVSFTISGEGYVVEQDQYYFTIASRGLEITCWRNETELRPYVKPAPVAPVKPMGAPKSQPDYKPAYDEINEVRGRAEKLLGYKYLGWNWVHALVDKLEKQAVKPMDAPMDASEPETRPAPKVGKS